MIRFFTLRRPYRYFAAAAAAFLAVAIGGCTALETKERELLFRPVKRRRRLVSAACPKRYRRSTSLSGDEIPASESMHGGGPRTNAGAPVVLLSPWRAVEPDRAAEPHVAAAQLRVFGIRHRLSRIRQERRRAAERGHRLRRRARWLAMAGRARTRRSRRFIYGHSLGGAVAIDLAAQLVGRSREGARADRRVVVHIACRDRCPIRATAGCHGGSCSRRSSIRSTRSGRCGCRC